MILGVLSESKRGFTLPGPIRNSRSRNAPRRTPWPGKPHWSVPQPAYGNGLCFWTRPLTSIPLFNGLLSTETVTKAIYLSLSHLLLRGQRRASYLERVDILNRAHSIMHSTIGSIACISIWKALHEPYRLQRFVTVAGSHPVLQDLVPHAAQLEPYGVCPRLLEHLQASSLRQVDTMMDSPSSRL
jgi:hypothetical protein